MPRNLLGGVMALRHVVLARMARCDTVRVSRFSMMAIKRPSVGGGGGGGGGGSGDGSNWTVAKWSCAARSVQMRRAGVVSVTKAAVAVCPSASVMVKGMRFAGLVSRVGGGPVMARARAVIRA